MKTTLNTYIIALMLLFVSCKTTHKFPITSSGKIIPITLFKSDYIDARNIDVWLPEGYNSKTKYPVIYMHDGQMLFDKKNTWNGQEWGVDEVMGELIKDGLPAAIVVGIWNNPATRHSDFVPQKAMEKYTTFAQKKIFKNVLNADNYLSYIVNEIKPYIDESFSTNPLAEHTFIAGSSMGGLISFYGLIEYPNIFGGAACLSTHWIVDYKRNTPYTGAIIKYFDNNIHRLKNRKLYMDRGTKSLDSLYDIAQEQIDYIIIENKISGLIWNSKVFEGASHTENDWKKRLNIPLKFLLLRD